MGVLNHDSIRKRMSSRNYDDKLVVTPLLSESQIGPASVDIRLGSGIVVPHKTYTESHDVTRPDNAPELEARTYEHVDLPYFTPKSRFVLHPGELILAVTFECFSLPRDIFATLASRSSWGRLGLVIATASIVQPGYKGSLTLELANLASSPISLYPGLPVGQIVFHEIQPGTQRAVGYSGRYHCPTDPEPPKFGRGALDKELEFWRQGTLSGKAPSAP